MKSIIFDTGPIISLTMNNLLWILEPLKRRFRGAFYITEKVREELIERPVLIKKFKFEALQVMRAVREQTIEILDGKQPRTNYLLELANSCFTAKNEPIRIVQEGEIEAVATALAMDADAIAIDERTTRMLMENPESLGRLLSERLNADVRMDKDNVKQFVRETQGLRVIRSAELVTIAYELGILKDYLPDKSRVTPKPKKTLLQAVLWGVKLDGCAISAREIDAIVELEGIG